MLVTFNKSQKKARVIIKKKKITKYCEKSFNEYIIVGVLYNINKNYYIFLK